MVDNRVHSFFMKLLVATQNPGKLNEFRSLLEDHDVEIFTPADFEEVRKLEVEETGSTFSENALLKAREFAKKSGVSTLADDSGLQVKALGGFPGVLSDRWHPGSAQEKNQALLEKMKGIDDRSARFVSCLCFFDPVNQRYHFFEGEVMGKIASQSQGSDGFGYDPVFIPDEFTETFAQLGTEVKNTLSHRKKAILKFKAFLKELL